MADTQIKAGVPQPVEEMRKRSFEARARYQGEDVGGLGVLYWLSRAGELVAPWWSKKRDADMRKKWRESNHFSGAVYTLASRLSAVPFQVEPRDMAVKSYQRDADEFQIRLEEVSEYGRGWQDLMTKWFQDRWTQDNGAFLAVIGDGRPDQPIPPGGVHGLAHLDSWRCTRTDTMEFPVVYDDEDGRRYKLHYTRVVYSAQLPSTQVERRGVGFCWFSRCMEAAQNLTDIAVYKSEKMGSRPLRAILVGNNISTGEINETLALAAQAHDAKGLRRFAMIPTIGQKGPNPITLDIVDLAAVPDGFDEEKSTTLGIYAIALAANVPARWLWPATMTGATKADAMFQHVAGLGGGAAHELAVIAALLGGSERGPAHLSGKFLPPHLRLTFDLQDDEQDRMQADIRKTRAEARELNLNTGATDIRTERENALKAGDISEDQFARMELEEGRLPDGGEVLDLFYSKDRQMQTLLDVGVEDPLDVAANDAEAVLASADEAERRARFQAVNAPSAKGKRTAEYAVAALRKLRSEYEEAKKPEQPAQLFGGPAAEGEEEDGAEAPDEEDAEAKALRPGWAAVRGLWPSTKLKQEPPRGNFDARIRRALRPALDEGKADAVEAMGEDREPDWSVFHAALVAALVGALVDAAVFSMDGLEEQFSLYFDQAEEQAAALAWARQYADQRAAQLVAATKSLVDQARQLEEAEAEALLDRAYSDERARRIGVTEATVALAVGAMLFRRLTMEKHGVEVVLRWYTRADERVCPVCAPLHRSTDWTDPPPLHPNCRCGLVAEIRRQ